ncbi:MAG: hypothetical protein ACOC1F_08650 [Myxococcota bacterium]
MSDGADTLFFLSGASYYEVLWTAPAGNIYYILARAWIAAQLNQLNGADGSAIAGEFEEARQQLEMYEPAQMAKVKGQLRKTVLSLAETLDQYNNGLIGPGHCSE